MAHVPFPYSIRVPLLKLVCSQSESPAVPQNLMTSQLVACLAAAAQGHVGFGSLRPAMGARARSPTVSSALSDVSLTLSQQLQQIREIRPADSSPEVQAALWKAAGLNPSCKLSGVVTGAPSFTRLFNHATWREFTGLPPMQRWGRIIATWRYSTILTALWPICLLCAIWAFGVASLPARFLPRTSPVPLTLMGSAIGLLLVFRSNNTYNRLYEARVLWGRAVFLCREIAQSVSTALVYESELPRRSEAREAAADVCR